MSERPTCEGGPFRPEGHPAIPMDLESVVEVWRCLDCGQAREYMGQTEPASQSPEANPPVTITWRGPPVIATPGRYLLDVTNGYALTSIQPDDTLYPDHSLPGLNALFDRMAEERRREIEIEEDELNDGSTSP